MTNYYETTESSGRPEKAYYYDKQLRNYVLQFMAVFAGLQVRIGKRDTGQVTPGTDCDGTVTQEPIIADENLISVPIHYGHTDRVVAAILGENTQNKVLRLPILSAYMQGIDFLKNYNAGIGTERRTAYLPTGGLIPDDIKVVYQRRSFPFELTMDLNIYASNTDQHFQILEQILMVFDPSLQIQTSDALFDMGKITNIELTNMAMDTNYPIGTDRRIIQSTLTFKMPIYLQSPADVRKNFIEKIYMRVGAVSSAAESSFDIIAELNSQGITTPIKGVNIGASEWIVLGNFTNLLMIGDIIQIFDNGADGNYTVVSTMVSGINTIITVSETIPGTATPTGNCKMPNHYELIMDVGDLTVQ